MPGSYNMNAGSFMFIHVYEPVKIYWLQQNKTKINDDD